VSKTKKGKILLLPALAVVLLIIAFCIILLPPIVTSRQADKNFEEMGLHKLEPPVTQDVRGLEYGEVIAVYFDIGKTYADVYYTSFDNNNITLEQYKALDKDAVTEELDAFQVNLNGPRFWVIDRITNYYTGEDKEICGYTFSHPAVVNISAETMKNNGKPYEERTVKRKTEYLIRAGEKIYELVSDTGEVYVMQSASREIDSEMTVEALDSLSERLDLPDGWSVRVRTLDKDTEYTVNGDACVIQDDFNNTYQKESPKK